MLKLPRSRSLRRIKTKLPGGRLTIHYKRRRPSHAVDPYTKEKLHGVPNLIPSKLKKLPKTKRRPNRPYGGVLSSSSLRKKIIENSPFPIKSLPIEIGRLILKTAGRDSGKLGVIVEVMDNHTVLIDGQVRRRKCNIGHLETLDKKIKIKPKATKDTIIKEFKTLNIEVKKTKPKPKKERLKKVRKVKEKKAGEEKVKPEEKLKKPKTKEKKPKEKESKKEKIVKEKPKIKKKAKK